MLNNIHISGKNYFLECAQNRNCCLRIYQNNNKKLFIYIHFFFGTKRGQLK